MKWVTRARAKVDRIACPWLIKNFIDREAEFIFVPEGEVLQVAAEVGATPFDVKGAELGHHGTECSFDAILKKYKIADPALQELAKIVRGADTNDRLLMPESPGLNSIADGFREISQDDHDNMAKQFPVYDALYAHLRKTTGE